MKAVILFSSEDKTGAMEVLEFFKRLKIPAVGYAVKHTWEDVEHDGLVEKIASGTHLIVYISEHALRSSWLAFVAGFSLGRDGTVNMFLRDPALKLPGYLKNYPCTSDFAEMETYTLAEKEVWERKERVEHAQQELSKMGLHFTKEAFIDAVEEGNKEAVHLFLQAGFSADTKNPKGVPLLCLAVRKAHRFLIPELLRKGADINARSDDRGNTALMDAASMCQADIVHDLLRAGASVDLASKNGQTALILAVGQGCYEVVKLLLEAGADIDVKDSLGMSAKKYAELFRFSDIEALMK